MNCFFQLVWCSLLMKGEAKDTLGFLVGDKNEVTFYNQSNYNRVVAKFNSSVSSVDYHLSKNLAFALTDKGIYKFSLNPKDRFSCELPTSIMNVTGDCEGFAVDWENDKIYWANCESNSVEIMSCDLSGDNLSTVLKLPDNSTVVHQITIDPYEKMLFWRNNHSIQSFTIYETGSLKILNGENEDNVNFFSLNPTYRRIYYTSNETELSLCSMGYNGSNVQVHFRVTQLNGSHALRVHRGDDNLASISVDESNAYVYHIPHSLTSTTQVKKLKELMRFPNGRHMRLVHPELQTRPVHNPCDNKGCSYYCTVTSRTAQCLCLRGLQLDNNGTASISVNKGSSQNDGGSYTTAIVVLVLFLIVICITVVLALYFPYFTRRNSTVMTVSYTSAQ